MYVDVKPVLEEMQQCTCRRPTEPGALGCGEDCINRKVWDECNPEDCPVADICANQRIQRQEGVPGVERFMTKQKGWGVRTTKDIAAGEYCLS